MPVDCEKVIVDKREIRLVQEQIIIFVGINKLIEIDKKEWEYGFE